jgi:LmbE family N-acetylglucosaminyl deacetylase
VLIGRRRIAAAIVLAACSAVPRRVTAQERGAVALGQLVAGLGNTARVLMIAAHPDDEDNRLLAWLSRGDHVETAYLSLTRGEGGQNLIGNELGDALGVIRTEELLAARRVDGAHQYFTRAYDFGFSKSAAESFTHWPHDSLLGDVVTIVRGFRPHVIIAVFSGTPDDGHGQHQVSAILAREAYDVSGDTVRFPTARYGPGWTVSKFYRDRTYFGGEDATLTINVGGYSPLLGRSYPAIAAESRSQHKSQGQGTRARLGPVMAYLRREATRVDTANDARLERSLFDGIDTTWHRLAPGFTDPASFHALDSLATSVSAVHSAVNLANPGPVLPMLARMARLVVGLQGMAAARARAGARNGDVERTLELAAANMARAVALVAAVAVDPTVQHHLVAAKTDSASVDIAIYDRGKSPRSVGRAGLPRYGSIVINDGEVAQPDSVAHIRVIVRDTGVTQPWWLATPRSGDLFTTPVSTVAEDERDDIGAEVSFAAGSNTALAAGDGPGSRTAADKVAEGVVTATVTEHSIDPTRGAADKPLSFVPAVSVSLDQSVDYVPAARPVDRRLPVLVRSGVATEQVVAIRLELPDGLTADSATRQITLPGYGNRRVEFRLGGSLHAGESTLRAIAASGGQTFADGYVPIEYDHIRPQKLYRPAEVKLVVVDVRVPRGLRVAYIPGVGDNVAAALAALGIPLTVIDSTAIATTDFSRFRAVVVGPRAYESNPDLRANNGRLLITSGQAARWWCSTGSTR